LYLITWIISWSRTSSATAK